MSNNLHTNIHTMKKHYLSLIVTALLAATLGHASAQTIPGEVAEAPPTTRMRVENIQVRHDKAIADLQTLFARIAKDSALVSSKEAVDAIDQGDRILKNNKTAIASVLASLRSESKSITAESSFTEDQKAELLAAVEAMITKCDDLSARTTVAVDHLSGAYKEMARWRKIHKAYRNLDGDANAGKQLEAAVKDYVKGLTAEPKAPADEAQNVSGAESPKPAEEKATE